MVNFQSLHNTHYLCLTGVSGLPINTMPGGPWGEGGWGVSINVLSLTYFPAPKGFLGRAMPYKLKHGSGAKPWKIINKATGKQVGSSKTKEEAQSSIKARMGSEHGWKPTGKKKR